MTRHHTCKICNGVFTTDVDIDNEYALKLTPNICNSCQKVRIGDLRSLRDLTKVCVTERRNLSALEANPRDSVRKRETATAKIRSAVRMFINEVAEVNGTNPPLYEEEMTDYIVRSKNLNRELCKLLHYVKHQNKKA